ncbi:trypsin-like peptidase domain-containing protein [Patescibacteria group bacterium]|nr:trypsin-like peptidase domain-containing protein [Patescibacteria group bacterium]
MKERSRVIRTVARVMPAVVSVTLEKHIDELRGELAAARRGKSASLKIPPEKIDAEGMVQIGGGSGFVVDPEGIVLTNKHVISEPGARCRVQTEDGATYDAEVLARDPVDDVAILRIHPKKPLSAVTLGDSDKAVLGQTVLAIGNALGLFKDTVSLGIISGLSRAVQAKEDVSARAQELRGLIQTDAAINPGNSGGPLVDIFGRAIGINAAVVVGAQNISFAIPIKAAERDLKDIKKYGRIRRPLFGVRYLVLNPDLSRKMDLPVGYGAYVTSDHPFEPAIVPKSPADLAKIKEKDIILEWNGRKIGPETTLQDFLDDCKVGDTVTVKLVRKDKQMDVKVTLTERK